MLRWFFLLSKKKKSFLHQIIFFIYLNEISFSKIRSIILAVKLRELFFFEITTNKPVKYAFIWISLQALKLRLPLGLFHNILQNLLQTSNFCFGYIHLSCFFETFPREGEVDKFDFNENLGVELHCLLDSVSSIKDSSIAMETLLHQMVWIFGQHEKVLGQLMLRPGERYRSVGLLVWLLPRF